MSWVNRTIRRDERTSYNEVRGISTKRGSARYYMSIIVLVMATVMFYVSAHYIGAFVNVNKAIAMSGTSQSDSIAHKEIYRRIAHIIGVPDYKRVYLRSGQAIEAQYELPDGAQIELEIMQCKQRPILEVFKCKAIAQSTSIIKDRRSGSHEIQVGKSGFYYFSAKVSPPELENKYSEAGIKSDYSLIWRRA